MPPLQNEWFSTLKSKTASTHKIMKKLFPILLQLLKFIYTLSLQFIYLKILGQESQIDVPPSLIEQIVIFSNPQPLFTVRKCCIKFPELSGLFSSLKMVFGGELNLNVLIEKMTLDVSIHPATMEKAADALFVSIVVAQVNISLQMKLWSEKTMKTDFSVQTIEVKCKYTDGTVLSREKRETVSSESLVIEDQQQSLKVVDKSQSQSEPAETSSLDMSDSLISIRIDRVKFAVSTPNGWVSSTASASLGNIKIGYKHGDGTTRPILNNSCDQEGLELNFSTDGTAKTVSTDLKLDGCLNVFFFPRTVALIMAILDYLKHPPKAVEHDCCLNLKRKDIFKCEWKKTYPELDATIAQNSALCKESHSEKTNQTDTKITIAIKEIRIGLGVGHLSGNQPLLLLRASSHIVFPDQQTNLTTDNKTTPKYLQFQLSYFSTHRGVLQPVFEPQNQGVVLDNISIRQLPINDVSIVSSKGIEFLLSLRLLEVTILVLDSFLRALSPSKAAKSLINSDNFLDYSESTDSVVSSNVIRNNLPFPLKFRLSQENFVEVLPGQKQDLVGYQNLNLTPISVKMDNYLDQSWVYDAQQIGTDVENRQAELQVIRLLSQSTDKYIDVGLHLKLVNRIACLTYYSPIWMVNNTRIGLMYQQEIGKETVEIKHLRHDAHIPLLMSMGVDKRLNVRIVSQNTISPEWTNIPLDKNGRIKCIDSSGKVHLFGIEIHFNSDSLTKQIILTPFYVLVNKAPFNIEVAETGDPDKRWKTIESDKQLEFWPQYSQEKLKLVFKHGGNFSLTRPFVYEEDSADDRPTILKLNDDCGALTIETRSSPSSVYICCNQYDPKHCPLVLINTLGESIYFAEPNQEPFELLGQESRFFSWMLPGNRELKLSVKNRPTICKDVFTIEHSEPVVETITGQNEICWTTIYFSGQRILVVTDKEDLKKKLKEQFSTEPPTLKFSLAISRLGVNLISEQLGDLLYLTIESAQNQPSQHGVMVELQQSSHHRKIGVVFQNIQLDCQLDGVVHQTILAKVPEQNDKPHLELYLHEVIPEFQQEELANLANLRLTIRPTLLRVELQVCLHLYNIILPRLRYNEALSLDLRMEADQNFSFLSFEERTAILLSQSKHLEIGKLTVDIPKLVTTFSTTRTLLIEHNYETLNPWMAMLFEISGFEDVPLEFGPFRLVNTSQSLERIQQALVKHACLNSGRHTLNIALGLGITRNVTQLLSEVGTGFMELFSDPSNELHHNMDSRLLRFCSHMVGGVSGFMANITDGLGTGIDRVTGDISSQRFRTRIASRTNDPKEKLVDSLNALFEGLTGGICDLVQEPTKGARKRGFRGFVKGVGKGLLGCLTKPMTGCLNMTSGVIRAADLTPRNPRNNTIFISKIVILPKRNRRVVPESGVIPDYTPIPG